MVCDCCLRRKKLFESYAAVETDHGVINLCIDCNDLAYKIRDDANEGNKLKYDEHLKELERRSKKAKPLFVEWRISFISQMKKTILKKTTDTNDTDNEYKYENNIITDDANG